MDKKIKVGITHGDINGVGYEVIMKEIRRLYPDYAITITSDIDIA